jgi:hypothetical protein
MDRPDCHTHTRCVMSVYLATLADTAPLPRCSGVSTRAMRAALRMMCRIAQNDGTMRYGLRASKLATLCEYSSSTIHRAERYLVEHGYVERVRVGGGRTSTHWRVVLDKLTPFAATSPDTPPSSPAPASADTETGPPRRRWANYRRSTSSVGTSSPAVTSVCNEHGGDGGTLPDGRPRCPQCRQSRENSQTRSRPP